MCSNKESLLRASSIFDLLAIGWSPGEAELDTARYIEHWAILPGPANRPYQIVGIAWSRPVRRSMIIASVIAIDPKAHWARIWDEWIILDDGLVGAPAFDPTEVARAGAAWLLEGIGHILTVH